MKKIDSLAIETLRVLSVEQSTKAQSGHPGIALGAAPMIHTLFTKIIKISPKHEKWINRDRFILAAGHGSSLLYSILHLSGYDLMIDDLKNFRQLGSKTPGHPEIVLTSGIDATSGPLGQGIPEAVGMAIAEAFLAAKYNKDNLELINHYTYVLCGDGDLQEGITQEAMSLAGHLGLNKLIVLYDSNDIQLDGEVSLTNSENVRTKYEAMGWNHLFVSDGENIDDIEQALIAARTSLKPTIIEIKTIIGYGTSVANTSKAHGNPISSEEAEKLRLQLGGAPFEVNNEVYDYYQEVVVQKGRTLYKQWEEIKQDYTYKYPREAEEFRKIITNDFALAFDELINISEDYKKATRVSSGEIINAISKVHPSFMGGSADLTSSTKAKGADGDFSKTNRIGRNINFGVREHAMAAISNGLALHQGIKPFCSGFFVFSDYMKPAMRLASIMELPVTYVFTHDSIAVGEDGATHQPIEQITMLRSIPHFNTLRPADAYETLAAWKLAYNSKNLPTALILTRQDTKNVSSKELAKNVEYGAYIIQKEKKKLDGIILASGSEVALALESAEKLAETGFDIRVVSIPSMYLFDQQPEEYRNQIIPKNTKNILGVEMSDATHFYKYLGSYGKLINIQKFGASAPGKQVIEHYGFTVDNVVEQYKKMHRANK